MKQISLQLMLLVVLAGCGRQSEKGPTVDPSNGKAQPANQNGTSRGDDSNNSTNVPDTSSTGTDATSSTKTNRQSVDPALREQIAKLAVQDDGRWSIDSTAKQFVEDRGPVHWTTS